MNRRAAKMRAYRYMQAVGADGDPGSEPTTPSEPDVATVPVPPERNPWSIALWGAALMVGFTMVSRAIGDAVIRRTT